MSPEKVVISGIGGLTSLGIDLAEHITNHKQGKCGVIPSGDFPYPTGFVGAFKPRDYISDRKSIRMMTRQTVLGVSSATLAFKDAELGNEHLRENDDKNAVIYGAFFNQGILSASGPYLRCTNEQGQVDYQALGEEGYRQYPPLWILPRLPNTTGGQVSIQYGLRGVSYSVVNGPCGGVVAAGEAFETIQDDRANRVLAGASESDPAIDMSFRLEQQQLIQTNGGLQTAEAGISYLIEKQSLAEARNLTPYAEIAAYNNGYLPNLNSDEAEQTAANISQHLAKTLVQAGLTADQIDAVQITCAGVESLDNLEAQAVYTVFGGNTPIVSSTANTGFAVGAAGASSLFYALLQIKHQYLAPVLNTEHKPQQQLNYVTAATGQNIEHMLVLHIDYLGNLVSLILNKTTAKEQSS